MAQRLPGKCEVVSLIPGTRGKKLEHRSELGMVAPVVMPAVGRQRQEDHWTFEASLGYILNYIARTCLQKNTEVYVLQVVYFVSQMTTVNSTLKLFSDFIYACVLVLLLV